MRLQVQGPLLKVIEADGIELKQLENIATRYVQRYQAQAVNRRKGSNDNHWDGRISYLYWYLDAWYLPAGLWRRVLALKQAKIPYNVQIDGLLDLFDTTVTSAEIGNFIETLEVPFSPRADQLDFLERICKAKNCCCKLATGYGKTYLSYLVARFLRDTKRLSANKKTLMIVPTQQLVAQCHSDFMSYQLDYVDNPDAFTVYQVYSGAKNTVSLQDAQFICGTYQSLVNYPADFFEQFDFVICDEGHKVPAQSIITIMKNCVNATYRLGISGSLPGEETLELLTIESYTGAFIGELNATDLVEQGILPDFVIKRCVIEHSDDVDAGYIQYLKQNPAIAFNPTKLLAAEQHHIMHCKQSNEILSRIICNLDMNTLVLCKRRDHIDELADMLRAYVQHLGIDKVVHTIKGGDSIESRQAIKAQVEAEPSRHIIVATIGTMAMGVSINALFYAVFCMYGHSQHNTIQGVGRLLRKHPSKGKAVVIDVAIKLATHMLTDKDCMRSYIKSNYDIKHQQSRTHIYNAERYAVDLQIVTFTV